MLQVIDRTIRVAAPPPSAPALPYRVEVFPYGYGASTTYRPTKLRDNGVTVGGDLLTPDEIAVWARLCWVKSEIARRKGEVVVPEHNPASPPPLPYEAKEFKYGVGAGVAILMKVRSDNFGSDGLTPDECAVWSFLQGLEKELEDLVPPESPTSNTVLETDHANETSIFDSALDAESPGVPTVPDISAPAPEVLKVAPESTVPTSTVPGEEVVVQVTSNTAGLTKRELAERALLESPTLNNCQLAEQVGVSDELVRRTRKELEAAGRLQPVAVLTKRDGTSYAIADAAVGDDTATG